MSKAKQNSLTLLAIAGLLIVLLAMSLPNLVLSPGEPFSLGQPSTATGEADVLSADGDVIMLIFRGIIALALILLPFYVVVSLLTPEGRQRLIANVVLIVLLLLLADYLQKHPLSEGEQKSEQAEIGVPALDAESGLPVTVFQATPPAWLTPAIILVASILVVSFMLVAVRFGQRRVKPATLSLEKLAEEAQNALESLQAGGDFKITVIHCYQEMSRIVRAERGIERDTDMTAREFETRLVSKGLPPEAIRTLTRLFEQVRYGSIPPGTGDEKLAFACLTEIVDACRRIERQA